jgi:predicted nuclease with TOPRIM domain
MGKKLLTIAVSAGFGLAFLADGETTQESDTASTAGAQEVSMSTGTSAQAGEDDLSGAEVGRVRREARTLRQEADKLRRMARRLEDDAEDLEERAQELLEQMREFRNSLGEFNRVSMGTDDTRPATPPDSTPVAAYRTYLSKQKLLMTNMRAIADGLQAKALEMATKVREMKEMADAKESAASGLEQKPRPRD